MMTIHGDGSQSLHRVVRQTLAADVTLGTLLPGGVQDATTSDDRDQGMDWAPKQADGVRIARFAFLRWRNALAASSQIKLSAESETLEVYLYDDFDYESIDQAANRIKALLHDSYIRCHDRQHAYISYAGLFGEFKDASLGHVPMKFIRFQILQIRK